MNKRKRINGIFNILVQFEKINDVESDVTEETYLNYLDRLMIWYMGYGNEDIVYAIKGLKELGIKANHDSVKRIVFHVIEILDKEGL